MIRTLSLSTFLLVSTLGITLSGCGKDDENRREDLAQKEIQSGTYASDRCFKNKLATQTALGSDRFSNATITFNDDHTGSAHVNIFTDPTCTTASGAEDYTFQAVTVESIGGVSVIKLDQGGVSPTWWIPANVSGSGYSFDVDYTDGESAPYVIVAPTDAQVASFGANPGQGVAFSKQ